MGNKSSKSDEKRKQIEECQLEDYETSYYWNKYQDDELKKYLQNYNLIAIRKIIVEYICYSTSNYKAYIHLSVTPLNDEYFIPKNWFMKGIPIVVMGNSACGKTSIINRFISNSWIEELDPTIEDAFQKQIALNVKQIEYDKYEACNRNYHNDDMNIDCATVDVIDVRGWGNQGYMSLESQYFAAGSIFFFVFNVMDHRTFADIDEKYRDLMCIRDDRMSHVPYVMILVGNKCDLRDDETYQNKYSPVNMDTVREYVKENKLVYIETSAKLNKNVCLLFRQSLYEYWIKYYQSAK
eukprot:98669_1